MNITKGKKDRAQKVVIYGSEGIGKSTLASFFPEPVFVDVEGGTAQLDVARVDGINDWQALLATVAEFSTVDIEAKTLVVDTIDKAELMCIDYICDKFKKAGIEEFGYGKGYTYLQEEFKKLIEYADVCIERGKNVVFLAHAKMRKFEQPDEMGAYDRWEMKLTKQVAPLVKEWADMVLFLNYQTFLVEDNKTKSKKAKGGKRVIFTSHHPCWDAKNRHGLPDEMPLQWDGPLAEVFTAEMPANLQQAQQVLGGKVESTTGKNVEEKLSPAEVVTKLAESNEISEAAVMLVLKDAGMCDDNLTMVEQVSEEILNTVIENWEDFLAMAKNVEDPF